MKKIIFTGLLLFLGTAFLQAQSQTRPERMTPEEQATRTVERLNKELKLTKKQQTELKSWFTESFKKRNEEFEKNREARKEALQKSREETDSQLKKILTADQYKQYQENEKKRQAEMKERIKRHGNRRW